MMSEADLLERHAERGTRRGAANVWARSQPEVAPPIVETATSWSFRLVLGVWLCAMIGAVVFATTRGSEVDTEDGSVAQGGDGELDGNDDDGLPLPILIEGMTLGNVFGPCTVDEGLVCDVDESMFSEFENFDPELGTSVPTIVIFGDEDSPFEGPVVGIETFDGGFRTWTLNLGQVEAAELVDQVTRDGDFWVLPEATGLVEIQRFEDSTDPLSSWQFDFSRAGLQPLRSEAGETATEWDWIVPLVRLADFGPTVEFATISLEPVDVLGRDAVEIVQPLLSDDGEIDGSRVSDTIWVDGDYAYRLTADWPTENAEVIDGLELVDRAEWERVVLDAWFDEGAESAAILATAAFFLVAAIMTLWFLFTRRWASIAIVLATGLGVWAFVSFPSATGVLVAGFGGLALASRVGRKPKTHAPAPPTQLNVGN